MQSNVEKGKVDLYSDGLTKSIGTLVISPYGAVMKIKLF